jgi:hypothetical protein
MKSKIIITIVILLILATGEAFAMGKMCLFSEVKGVVVMNGIPVSNAIVEQEFRWVWKDEVGNVQVKTDAAGKFSFPAAIRSSFFGSLLPHEPMIRQTILIKHEGKEYKAWMFDKGNYKENGELQGKPISLYCELNDPLSHKGEVYGICQLR